MWLDGDSFIYSFILNPELQTCGFKCQVVRKCKRANAGSIFRCLFNFPYIKVRKVKFRVKILKRNLKPCSCHRVVLNLLPGTWLCVLQASQRSLLFEDSAYVGKKHEPCTFVSNYSDSVSVAQDQTKSFAFRHCKKLNVSFLGSLLWPGFLRLSSRVVDCDRLFGKHLEKLSCGLRKKKKGVLHTVFIHFTLRRSCSHLPRPAD